MSTSVPSLPKALDLDQSAGSHESARLSGNSEPHSGGRCGYPQCVGTHRLPLFAWEPFHLLISVLGELLLVTSCDLLGGCVPGRPGRLDRDFALFTRVRGRKILRNPFAASYIGPLV